MLQAVGSVLLFPTKYQVTWFSRVMALEMINHTFRAYRAIDEIILLEKSTHTMGVYYPFKPLAIIFQQI